MYIHNLDPVIVEFGAISLRWYSLSYLVGILFGWWYGNKIISKLNTNGSIKLTSDIFDDFITTIIISIIIGGRLGYIIFYNLNYYLENPLEILMIWKGGMSFHGGLLGIIIGSIIYSVKKKIDSLILLDIVAIVSPIGLFFGRISNFINGELIGKPTNVPWSVVFPFVDDKARHPSQIYEALLEGLLLFLILNLVLIKFEYVKGKCASLFLIFYAIFRIFSEFFREPDIHIGYFFNYLSMGTILSFFMLGAGLFMFWKIR